MRIIEIIRRSKQGITRPFFCKGEDGEAYYVKGRYAGYRALCCEWVAGELARRWGLPIAPFSIVDIPTNLIKGSLREDAFDLGDEPAFASRLVQTASELRWSEVVGHEIHDVVRAQILIFDWWIANPDRTLNDTGGNPNLLWSASEAKLSMIDHNLAFSTDDISPSLPEFGASHIFGGRLLEEEASFWEGEKDAEAPLLQATDELSRFWSKSDSALDEIWSEMPEEWIEGVIDFTLEDVRSFLDRVESDDFWGIGVDSQ